MRPALLLALAPIAFGCVSTADGARAAFVEAHVCPEDRVVVRERPDLDPAELLVPDALGARPVPPHAASDPERARLWCELEADRAARVRRAHAGHDVFEVEGCGRAALLVCAHPAGPNGAIRLDRVRCRDAPPRPAAAPAAPGAGCPAR